MKYFLDQIGLNRFFLQIRNVFIQKVNTLCAIADSDPIYFGFGAANDGGYNGLITDAHMFTGTVPVQGFSFDSVTNTNGNGVRFYIIVPSALTVPMRFVMGGVEFLTTMTTATINSKSYKVYASVSLFNENAVVKVDVV